MSGNRYFLDTNAIVQLLAGNPDVLNILSKASYIAISVICELEFLAFPGLTENDRRLFDSFAKRVEVIDLCSSDSELKDRILAFRSGRKLKLPDAIIAASASVHACVLLTADKRLQKVPGLPVRIYRPA